MEAVMTRYRNLSILGAVLFAQMVGLAAQVRRPTPDGSAPLLRLWVGAVLTPFERGSIKIEHGVGGLWHNYAAVGGIRSQNAELKNEVQQLRLQQARLQEDAAQANRLQKLLTFKEQFVSKTVAAQVIGTSGSEQSRLVYLDKGTDDGIAPDMAVVTPSGIVGKVIEAAGGSSRVLLINDQLSGVGAMLEQSRLQGIVRGSAGGALVLHNVMNDEKVEKGEMVVASGGDRVFPKGMPLGRVQKISNGPDVFFNIELAPAADLNRLEEVLVITKMADQSPVVDAASPMRAADMLAGRLPSVPPPSPTDANGKPIKQGDGEAKPAGVQAAKPASQASTSPTKSNAPKPTPPLTSGNALPQGTRAANSSAVSNSAPAPASGAQSPAAAPRSSAASTNPSTNTKSADAVSSAPGAIAKPISKPPKSDQASPPVQPPPAEIPPAGSAV